MRLVPQLTVPDSRTDPRTLHGRRARARSVRRLPIRDGVLVVQHAGDEIRDPERHPREFAAQFNWVAAGARDGVSREGV